MDVNNPPRGGFQQGAWYWNPQAGQAQRWWNGAFLPVGQDEPGRYLQGQEPQQQEQAPLSYADQLIKNAVDTFTSAADSYRQKSTEFDAKNPFIFDKVLEEEKANATQRFDPYYNQTLSDYLTGIETRRTRSVEDERTLLTELNADKDFYTGRAKIQLDNALEKSREGYAEAGLYGSGRQLRESGQLEEAGAADTQKYLAGTDRQEQNIRRGTQRTTEDLSLDEKIRRREIEREKSYNIESTGISEAQRRQQQREFEKGQYTGAPPSIDPNQFSSYLYRQLG